MTLADFFLQAIEHIYGLWPLRIVREWEQGIRLFRGRVTALITGPRLAFFWPLIGEIQTTDANWEVEKTALQDLTTADGQRLTVQFTVQWRVRDMKALWVTVQDTRRSINEQVESAAGLTARRLTAAEAVDNLGAMVHDEARRLAYGWGVEIRRVTPTTLVVVQPLRLIQNGAAHDLSPL